MANPWFRWLLRLDQPLPSASEAEQEAFVQRHYRWNASVNLVDGLTFWLGLTFISATTIVPLFISKLTTSAVPVGIAATIAQSGWYLPQLLTANWVEGLEQRKPAVVALGLLTERTAVWGMVVAALLAARHPSLALALFMVSYAWRGIGGGLVAPAWQDLIARVIPVRSRGRFWGLTSSLGVGLGVAGSALSAWLLNHYPFPGNFVRVFSLAATLMIAGWVFLSLTREPPLAAAEPKNSQRQYFASLPGLLKGAPAFRRFLVGRTLLALGTMGLGFVTVAAIRRWHIDDGTVGVYTALVLLGQAGGNLVFGLRADRHGHKQSLEWAALAQVAGFTLAWLAPAPGWYLAVFFLLGVALGAMIVSGMMVVFEFTTAERLPTYVGITNTSVGLANVAGPLLATALAGVHFGAAFAASAAVSLAAWVILRWWVREPRWQARA